MRQRPHPTAARVQTSLRDSPSINGRVVLDRNPAREGLPKVGVLLEGPRTKMAKSADVWLTRLRGRLAFH